MLIHGDCFVEMEKLPHHCADMVLCDLPYGVTQNKWDECFDFEDLWNCYDRVCKPTGAIVLFCQGMFTTKLLVSNPNLWRYNLVWEKDRVSGFLNAKKQPLRSHEDIAVFYWHQPTYNPQMWEGEPLHGMGKKFKEGKLKNNNYGSFSSGNNPSALREGDTSKYPRSVLYFPKEHPPIHPTQKPVALCEYLIRTYTNEGDTVLDNCMGSGSTIVAAINTNRKYIGIEKEEEYFKKAEERAVSASYNNRLPVRKPHPNRAPTKMLLK